jgi:hypothetical protein
MAYEKPSNSGQKLLSEVTSFLPTARSNGQQQAD